MPYFSLYSLVKYNLSVQYIGILYPKVLYVLRYMYQVYAHTNKLTINTTWLFGGDTFGTEVPSVASNIVKIGSIRSVIIPRG